MNEKVTHPERSEDRERWWQIHDKDSYVCPDCGRTQAEHAEDWEVHHIDCQAGKIVGLCEPCHDIRHGADPKNVDLEAWKAAFLGQDTTGVREDHSERTIGSMLVYDQR